MEVRKRTWKTADGKKKTAFFMDYVCPVTGKRMRETLKASNKPTADLFAASRWERICREAELGKAAGPTPEQKLVTLEPFLENDLERLALAANTKRIEKYKHKALCRHIGANTPIVEIDYWTLKTYREKRSKEDVANSTINDDLAVLRAALNRAKKEGRLWAVPEFPDKLPEQDPLQRFLMPEEVFMLIKTLREMSPACARAADIVEVMYCLGGMRPCEVWHLKWEQVNLKQRKVSVLSTKRGTSKKIRYRHLPMTGNLVAIFTRQRDLKPESGPKDLVFGIRPEDRIGNNTRSVKRGFHDGVQRLDDFDFNRKLKRAAKRAKIDNPETVTAYALRHSAATNAEADDVDVSYMLGHSSVKTTLDIYRHMRSDRMKFGVESLSRHMEGTKDSATVHDIAEIKEVG